MLASFDDYNVNYNPTPLLEATDGNFYGFGPSTTYGRIIKVSRSGTMTRVADFNGSNGAEPRAALIEAADGNFYGTTFGGGRGDEYGSRGDAGTLFRLTRSGTLTTLVLFDAATGSGPLSELVEGEDGCLYGSTSRGGSNGTGTLFRLTVSPPRISAAIQRNVDSSASLTIRGQFFSGTSRVEVGGAAVASFKVDSPTEITATLRPNQPTAPLVVATALGVASLGAGSAASAPLLNLSARLHVLTGDNALIGGFILSGSQPKKLLLRGLGPSLTAAGAADPLQDPTFELIDRSGIVIGSNNDWQSTEIGGGDHARPGRRNREHRHRASAPARIGDHRHAHARCVYRCATWYERYYRSRTGGALRPELRDSGHPAGEHQHAGFCAKG